ncbi:bifunctional demethylmenaquinone methyltransferase/2-methoxy-6-polyprenyl-1,4-benzoquinol methylase UbiE [Marinithermus hydrothermalis]|uniref:Demethylmenaquinone methyltransferase n=1 Tax=Marinithermus hydrothermalis (strain DSM 14884 / JCM 11576 / T1) TaxID=869210 RepID=F2NNC7_MARHT|nr:bifunctional demethylmenaquinone methyltransferase/2-methoxy-6-polyprenyl-1,4-benzoquinol methylase UbiE [Marinithermus hydrothermalis]AEB10968.1 Ubiquinone/menaquinone biosynthesis methyltransferase ubiE [Marinithermus hydrothermalis DSM 14884]
MPNSETPKAQAVQQMFSEIAPRYDLLNRVLSLGVDQRWRSVAATLALEPAPTRVLDVATGTGDLALLMKRLRPEAEVIGLDFAAPMLERAREKAAQLELPVTFIEGDALAMPFPDASFEALTVAFGFRNFADYAQGLEEFYRVLTPGGRAVILEFPPPPAGLLGRGYRLYFERVLPRIGGLISGKPEAYRYLPASVARFPKPEALAAMMREAGFRVRYRLLTGGIAAVFVGDKPYA